MKVLSIGQLPKEVGGNYTTGVARVVHELSKQTIPGVQQYLYASNISNEKAARLCKYPLQYSGYNKIYGQILKNVLLHPIRTIKQWIHYKNVCHMNPLRLEFHRANIEEVIKKVHPDIIHNHSSFVSSTYFAARKYNIPMIRTYHGLVYKSDGDTKYQKVADEALGTKTFADYYTALTKENALEVEKLGIDKSIITIIPNGIDSSKYYFSPKERERIRKDYNATEETRIFMTVGRLIDRKGQLAFLKILASSNIDFQYWIFGTGPDYDAIRDFVSVNHLDGRVSLFGQVNGEELYKYHSAADFYSHASTTEGQSLAEIEAYASGLRIVVNSLIAGTVIGNAFEDKEDYYVMDFDHYEIDEFDKWTSIPNTNRHSRTTCDWSIIAKQYGELYKKIMNARH